MRTAVKWGAILGAAIMGWTLIIHLLGFYTTRIGAGQRADIAATVLPVAAIVLALRERRAVQGSLSFAQALITALVVGLVSVPLTAGFLWWYHHYMNPRWLEYLIDYRRAAMTASGATPEAIDVMADGLRSSGTDGAQLAGAIVGTTAISLLIGAVAGAFLRTRTPRPRPRPT